MASAAIAWDLMNVNLPENSDSAEQQKILDALPVLVFLERAGRIVFANAEARQMLGMTEGEWIERPVEEVLWGLFPGTAEPQTLLTGTRRGSPFHATMPGKNGGMLPVEGTYSILNAQLRQAVIVAHPGGRERTPKPRPGRQSRLAPRPARRSPCTRFPPAPRWLSRTFSRAARRLCSSP